MPNKHWILSVNPVQIDIAVPGRLVTNRKAPQNYFDARVDPNLRKLDPNLTRSDFRDLADVHNLFNSNKLSTKLTSFFSQHLHIASDTIRSIEATKAQRCQLVQADEWLQTICSAKAAQGWLERKIISLKQTVWMITDILILEDAKIRSIDKHAHSVGGEISAPVLSIAGVPIPTPLDPSVGASTARQSSHERAITVPDKMVFAIQYCRVKLLKQRRSEVAGAVNYELLSRATWTPMWEERGTPQGRRIHDDEDGEEDNSDEYDEDIEASRDDEEVLEATLTDDDGDCDEVETSDEEG